jgi:hypothetical protein
VFAALEPHRLTCIRFALYSVRSALLRSSSLLLLYSVRFGHGATDTLVKAADRARELLASALEGMEKDQEKLRQETEEVQMGLVEVPPSFFGDFPT